MLTELRIADYALDGRTHAVEAEGQIDLYSAPALKESILGAIDAGKTRLIVDLSRVTFMDSTGLGVLVGARKRLLEAGGAIAVVAMSDDVVNLFELTGLDSTLNVVGTRDLALEAVQAESPES